MDSFPLDDLTSWFYKNRRFLPWRAQPTPYSVWVSEVMLQQTQALRVLLYFQRWMTLFPTVQALAESSEESVMKVWEGLGYYSRARALRKGAQYIQKMWGGLIPESREELLLIPGIGEYTQGAIRSFAFHQKAAAVDANVFRVISRVYDLAVQQGSGDAYTRVRAFVEKLLPENDPWIVMEALIELGALVCGKKTACVRCPLCSVCQSRKNKTWKERPLPKKPMKRVYEKRKVFVFVKQESMCVIRRQGKGVMSGLWEFPYCLDGDSCEQLDQLSPSQVLDPIKQTFTNHCVTLYPCIFHVKDDFFWHEGEWHTREKLLTLPFSAGHKKILEGL